MKVLQLFILIFAFLMIKPAQAALLLEPVVGYSFGKSESDNAKDSNSTGPSFGGRVGYQQLGFQLGIDYLHTVANLSENEYKSDMNIDEFAGFVGFEFPVLFRVYAGYIFSSNADVKYNVAGNSQKLELTDGSGMKFGLGFTGLPFVDINFEYRKVSWDKWKLAGLSGSDDNGYNAFMIGASVPLTF